MGRAVREPVLFETYEKRVIHQGPGSVTVLPRGKGCGPASRRAPPRGARVMGGGTPPGSAGVPPACTAVRCRSVSLRWGSRPPFRRERHETGPSRAPVPLPVEPGGEDGRGCARICAGGTPALPGGLHSVTSSQPRRSIGNCDCFWLVFNNRWQYLPRMIRTAVRGPATRELLCRTPEKLPSSNRCTGWWGPSLPDGC